MLDRGRSHAAAAAVPPDRLAFVEADLVDLVLPDAGRYAFAFIALNSIMLLASRDAQRAAFRTLAAHLAPGGLAAVDAWLPDAEDLGRFDGRVILEWPRTDPDSGAVVTKVGSAQHDVATNTITLHAIYEEGRQGEPPHRWVRQDRLRLVSADELRRVRRGGGAARRDPGRRLRPLADRPGLGAGGPRRERPERR